MTVYEFIQLFLDDSFPLVVYSLDEEREVYRGLACDIDDWDIEQAEIMSIDNPLNPAHPDSGNNPNAGLFVEITVNI